MAAPFERTLQVGWGDLDANQHMRNTAYLDRSADVRMMYFLDRGFSMREFARLHQSLRNGNATTESRPTSVTFTASPPGS